MIQAETNAALTFEDFKNEVLNDYKIDVTSRECSLLGCVAHLAPFVDKDLKPNGRLTCPSQRPFDIGRM